MRSTTHVYDMAVPHVFSPNGEYFAYSSPDGTLKLWDSATGTLKQEYTPSSHLSSTCTCLSFAPIRHASVSFVSLRNLLKLGKCCFNIHLFVLLIHMFSFLICPEQTESRQRCESYIFLSINF